MVNEPDADKPVALLRLDVRGMGPLVCEHCEEFEPEDSAGGELEEVFLMEDGGVVCPQCRTPLPNFEEFSRVITSVSPVKLKGAGHVCGDRCRERGCRYGFPEAERE